ncbi:MAG: type II toxin-antitoxin system death-on-curing family toxin [Nitrososphaerota archaeon]|nr:type II toxin-antitoxin system death-on-curing family toxin [Nitrososphaerota archaeon]
MSFDDVVHVNQVVVALSRESHAFSDADGDKLSALTKEVEARADNLSAEEAIPEKACLLVFKLASGQYFHAGNKRTALVAGVAFLAKNGYHINLRDQALIDTVDRAGVAAATLDDLFAVTEGLLTKARSDRKGWAGVVDSVVASNREYLTSLAA